MRQRRILYNSDGWNIFFNAVHPDRPLSAQDVGGYVKEVAFSGSQVDTFILCVNAGLAYYPSRVIPMYGQEGYDPKDAVDVPASQKLLGENLRRLLADGLDPVGLVIDQARELGLEVILSYRMNDAHHLDEDTPMMPPFWREHPQWRTDRNARFGGAYDYAVPQVRRFMLDQLAEVLDRYGHKIDGLELDWMRFPRYFNPGCESQGLAILTEFTREVKKLIDQTAAARRRKLLLTARVWHRPDFCLRDGFDVFAWAEQGLIDFLTISRFLRNGEGTLDVAAFRSQITSLPIYGAIEVGSHNVWPANADERAIYDERVRPHLLATPDQYRRESLRLWNDGADGIYLFNFFCPRETGIEPDFSLLAELGDPRTIKKPSGEFAYCTSVSQLLSQVEAQKE
ncbi:MAG: hypothetical protein GXY33_10205 [Phycisphaerae bacterium]|nr:hypothetical protein [Phycisphaerae bacterium]